MSHNCKVCEGGECCNNKKTCKSLYCHFAIAEGVVEP